MTIMYGDAVFVLDQVCIGSARTCLERGVHGHLLEEDCLVCAEQQGSLTQRRAGT